MDLEGGGAVTSGDIGPRGDGAGRPERAGLFQVVSLAVGWAVIIFALHGMLADRSSNPPHLFRLLIGLNIVNDAVAIPIVLAISVLLRRVLPPWCILSAQIGLFASAVVVLYAYPLLGDWGRTVNAGSSRLPFNYAHNILWVLATIWLVCGAILLWQWRRHSVAR
jgi:hypothetical protein